MAKQKKLQLLQEKILPNLALRINIKGFYLYIVVPLLHIKPGLMKQFVKACPKGGAYFNYLCQSFPSLSELKQLVFKGFDIRKLTSESEFDSAMNYLKLQTRVSLKEVISKFLDNNKDSNYT